MRIAHRPGCPNRPLPSATPPRAWAASISATRHARACPAHPRLSAAAKTWMAGPSPAMTTSDLSRYAPGCVDSPAGRLTLSGCSEGSSGQGAESSPSPSWGAREKPFEPDPGHAGEGTGQSVPSLPRIRPAEPNAAFVKCRDVVMAAPGLDPGVVPAIHALAARRKAWMRGTRPIRANLRRNINLSVVIVRACGRSSNHGKSGFGTAVPQPALRGLPDAPLEAGHDNPRDRRGKLKLARMGTRPRMTRIQTNEINCSSAVPNGSNT